MKLCLTTAIYSTSFLNGNFRVRARRQCVLLNIFWIYSYKNGYEFEKLTCMDCVSCLKLVEGKYEYFHNLLITFLVFEFLASERTPFSPKLGTYLFQHLEVNTNKTLSDKIENIFTLSLYFT